MTDESTTPFQETTLTPANFPAEALQAFDMAYSPDAMNAMRQEGDPRAYTAIRNSRSSFEMGDSQAGWDSLEGGLAVAGWTDAARELSLKITGAEEDCGLATAMEPAESLDLALDFIGASSSPETGGLLERLRSLGVESPARSGVLEALLQKVETGMGAAVRGGNSHSLRKRLRDAQHALYLEKIMSPAVPDGPAQERSRAGQDEYDAAMQREILRRRQQHQQSQTRSR